MVKILFVCHGNICRSPMAEFVMKRLAVDMRANSEKNCANDRENRAGNVVADRDCTSKGAASNDRAESPRTARSIVDSGIANLEFEIASAATSTEEIGNPVYPPARRMLAAHGIDCSGKTARQMTARDYEHYDYIVLMDRNNLRNLRWILPADIYELETSPQAQRTPATARKVSLLMEWTGKNRDVADPWYTGDFEATWRDVNEGCKALLGHILSSHSNSKQNPRNRGTGT